MTDLHTPLSQAAWLSVTSLLLPSRQFKDSQLVYLKAFLLNTNKLSLSFKKGGWVECHTVYLKLKEYLSEKGTCCSSQTYVQLPAPTLGGSQHPITPPPGNPDSLEPAHMWHTFTHTNKQKF